MLLSLTLKGSDLSSLLLDLLLKLSFPLLCSPNFLPQFNQVPINRFSLDAPESAVQVRTSRPDLRCSTESHQAFS
jgi:hypothetical protein